MDCININVLNHTVDDERSQLAISAEYDRRLPIVVMLSLFGLIGIPGNAIVLKVYWREKKLKATQFLIFAIAFFDFNTSLVAIPLNLVRNTYWFEILDIRFCKLVLTLNMTLLSPPLYLVAGVSLVRYYHVYKPHAILWIERRLKYFFVLIFLIQMFLSVSMFIAVGCQSWHKNDQNLPGFLCDLDDRLDNVSFFRSIVIMVFVSYWLCVFGIMGINVRILTRIITQRRKMLMYKSAKKGKSTSLGKPISKGQVETIVKGSEKSSKRSDKSCYTHATSLSMSSSDARSYVTKGDVTSEFSYLHTDIEDQEITEARINSKLDRQSFLEHRKQSRRQSSKSSGKTTNIQQMVEETDSDQLEETENLDKSLRERTMSLVSNLFGYNRIRSNSRASETGTERERSKSKSSVDSKQGINARQSINSRKKKSAENRKKKQPIDTICCVSCYQVKGLNRTTLKLSITALVYIITYLPYFTSIFLVVFNEHTSRQNNHGYFKYIILPGRHMPFLSAAVNPLIYTFIDPKFRAQCRALFTRT